MLGCEEEPSQFILSRDQGIRLLGLITLVQEGELALRCHEDGDPDDEEIARDVLVDIGQEIAIQLIGY